MEGSGGWALGAGRAAGGISAQGPKIVVGGQGRLRVFADDHPIKRYRAR